MGTCVCALQMKWLQKALSLRKKANIFMTPWLLVVLGVIEWDYKVLIAPSLV